MLMLKVRCFDVTNQYSHRFHDDILCRLFFPLIAILVDFQNAHPFLLWNCTTGFTDFVAEIHHQLIKLNTFYSSLRQQLDFGFLPGIPIIFEINVMARKLVSAAPLMPFPSS